jgi:hypothetical protein
MDEVYDLNYKNKITKKNKYKSKFLTNLLLRCKIDKKNKF